MTDLQNTFFFSCKSYIRGKPLLICRIHAKAKTTHTPIHTQNKQTTHKQNSTKITNKYLKERLTQRTARLMNRQTTSVPRLNDRLSSLQSLDRLGHWGNMRDDSAEILFQSFLKEAFVSSSGLGRNVHSLTFSVQRFLCQPRCRPPSKVP